jgi:hypothetical protein
MFKVYGMSGNFSKEVAMFETIHEAVSLWPEATIAGTVIRRRMVYAASMGNGFGVTESGDKFPQAAHEIALLTLEVIRGTL